MAEGKFRSDLYYRLKVFPIQMPPLRMRRSDIPLLVWGFISARQIQLGKKIAKVPREIMRTLQAFDWPGNIRELENVIERALIVSAGPVLVLAGPLGESTMNGGTGDALPNTPVPGSPQPQSAARFNLKMFERRHILTVLDKTAWRIKGAGGAAELLGLKPTTLNSKMKKLKIKRPTQQFDISPWGRNPVL